ncbi:MAG: hypothetical protein ABSG15_14000, partial [FCB group bacterium]
YQGSEIKAEFIVVDGIIKEILFKNVYGKKRFESERRKDFEFLTRKILSRLLKNGLIILCGKKI